MICPDCNGEKEVAALVHIDGSCKMEMCKCFICEGSGEVPDEFYRYKEEGIKHRVERTNRGETLGQCAKRLGWRVSEVSALERGKKWKTPLWRET